MNLILASASPRRKELLGQIGLEFRVIPAQGEEVITKQEPGEVVMELAAQKAGAVREMLLREGVKLRSEETASCAEESALYSEKEETLLILGADTVVVHQGRILGKPHDEAEAKAMVSALSGDTHQVYTGVCLLPMDGEGRLFFEKTDVTFYPMTAEEIAAYVATGDPMDKAGAYGIQGICARHIRGIAGDYNNVVGLPVGRVYQELRSILSQG